MRQKTVYLSGIGFWMHRLFEPDEYLGIKKWSMRLYPDPKSQQTLKAEGIQLRLNQDDEGKFITLKRPVLKKWKLRAGENPEFDPPIVRTSEGKEWDMDMPSLGNGSKVTVKLEVYPTVKGKGTRLCEVRVDELVEYVPPDAVEAEATDNIRPF